MNTIEQFAIFLPLLWLATTYFRIIGWVPAALGLVWCLGRVLYSMGYMRAAEKRGPGFGIAALASLGLLILSVYGLIATWIATTVV
jgi:glutathione S-transferase